MSQTMSATLQWQGGASFTATAGSGHSVTLDGPADHGGKNLGCRPMEMILIGLGGCAAYDVVYILQKSRQNVSTCHVNVSAMRSDEVPAVFTEIHLSFEVKGKNLPDDRVARAVKLSAEKYCSASRMLEQGGVNISHDFKVEQEPA